MEIISGIILVVGLVAAAERLGKARGPKADAFKKAAVALAAAAGFVLLGATWGWVASPTGILAAAAGAGLMMALAVVIVDLADGQPDRGCRIAALLLPILLVAGGAWLFQSISRAVPDGISKVTTVEGVR